MEPRFSFKRTAALFRMIVIREAFHEQNVTEAVSHAQMSCAVVSWLKINVKLQNICHREEVHAGIRQEVQWCLARLS